ncbi:hypothetical protein C8R43DRAFT_1123994 [Mycena crocata]|nr:hypothetical protein C8R43DRAFT_1123994 [Mycena crocata]
MCPCTRKPPRSQRLHYIFLDRFLKLFFRSFAAGGQRLDTTADIVSMESFAVSRTPASRRAAGAQTFTLYSDFPGAESKLLPPEANIQLRLPDSGSFELVPYHCTREPPRSSGWIDHYIFRVLANEVSPQNFCRRRPTPRSKFQAASPPQHPPRSSGRSVCMMFRVPATDFFLQMSPSCIFQP